MRFTIFTPTYNRGYIIENLYHSLQKQTFRNFEWVVIDDGSDDNTEDLFKKFINENNFFYINYVKVQNGGKHRAINIGVQKAKGELFFIVDSDDYITDNALEVIDEIEKNIPNNMKNKFAGVSGNRGYTESEIIGTTFDGDLLDITQLERSKYHITGDKAEIFYTDILKKYPFPEFLGEKFLTECIVWDRIAYDGYKLRFFNNIIYICNYLNDGLTAKYRELLWNNPKGYGLYLQQEYKFGKIGGIGRWNDIWDYMNHYKGEMKFSEIAKNLNYNPISFFFRMLFLYIFYKTYG